MTLADGTALSGRDVSLAFSGSNAVLAKQSAQPSGTTRTSAGTATATTGADGPSVSRPTTRSSSPQVGETGDTLDATALTRSAPTLTIDFLVDMAPATVTFTGQNNDALGIGAGHPTPGDPVELGITVKNSVGDRLADTPVTISLDHGFVPQQTNSGDFVPATVPTAATDLVGDWASNGTSVTVMTNDSGVATVPVTIGRDAAFDNNGTLTMTVSASAGTVTQTSGIDFSTTSPLNGAALSFDLAPGQSQLTVLPNVLFDSTRVYYNVVATDQFGNPVSTSYSGLSISGNGTWDWNCNYGDTGFPNTVADSYCATQVSLYDYNSPGTETAKATWGGAPVLTFADSNGSKSGFQYGYGSWSNSTQSLTGTVSLNWYNVDAANSTFTLTNDTTNNVAAVGTTVTEKLTAVDQYGVPLRGADVQFLRSGPGSKTGNNFDSTSALGTVVYNYLGTSTGPAESTAVVDWNGIQITKLYDTVTFKEYIGATLSGHSSANGQRDVLKVSTVSDASGATVVFFRGHHRIGKAVIGANGEARIARLDKNGRRFFRYHARIRSGSITFAASTNWIRIR